MRAHLDLLGSQVVEVELQQLGVFLDGAKSGEGAVVLVTGQSGVGKTSLLRRFVTEATSRGARAMVGGSTQHRSPAFWPWTKALRHYAEQFDPPLLPVLTSRRSSPLLSLIADCSADLQEAESALDDTSHTSHLQLFDAFVRYRREATSASPILLALEDIHLPHPAPLSLLEYVAHQSVDLPVMILLSCINSHPQSAASIAETLVLRPMVGVDAAQTVG